MMSRFQAACAVVLSSEGLRSDDPRDRGGLTVYGHDQASWPDLLERVPASVVAQLPARVDQLTLDQAILAYRSGYWDTICGDSIPAALALLAFDAAVNQGPYWAPSALQLSVGVHDDGVLGPVTMTALAHCDVLTVLGEYGWRRDQRYRAAGNWGTYGHGWVTRLNRTLALSTVYDDPAQQLKWLPHVGAPE